MQKRKSRTLFLLAAALLAATPLRPLAAQSARASIDPGMTREQVVERLGRPVGERSAGGFTYLFYANGCERRCGMHDLVVLQDGAVTDAVFRSSARRYTGTSSSPSATGPSAAARDADASRDVDATASAPARPPAPRGAGARRPAARTPALRIDAPRGGIVTGGDVTGGAAPGAARRAGAPADGAAPPDTAADSTGSRNVRTMPGPVRVPTLPQDTTVGRPPSERNVRTLPGPVRVPTLPQDTLGGRDSAARRTPPPVRRPPAATDAPNRTL